MGRRSGSRGYGTRQGRPDVDQGDQGATLGHDPQVVLAAMEVEAAQDAGGRRRQVGLDEPRVRELARPPELAEEAPLVAVTGDRPVDDTGQGRGGRTGRAPVAGGHARVRVARRSVGA